MYLQSSNNLHSILVSVLCKKIKQYCLKFHASGQCWIQVEPCGMVQPITHNLVERKQEGSMHTTWYTRCEGHKMEVFPVHMQAIILQTL